MPLFDTAYNDDDDDVADNNNDVINYIPGNSVLLVDTVNFCFSFLQIFWPTIQNKYRPWLLLKSRKKKVK